MLFSPPKFLYKYLSQEGAQNLFDSEYPSIRFSLPRTFNDPYDVNPSGSSSSQGLDAIGVLCLCETPTSIPMWGHYGYGKVENEAFKKSIIVHGGGVVLEFSTNSDFFKKYNLVKVKYAANRPTIKCSSRKQLAVKSKEWSYEREWRCFTHLWDDRYLAQNGPVNFISIPFPFEALTKVIHGYDSRVSASTFLDRPEAQHVLTQVCHIDSRKYRMNIVDLDNIHHLLKVS